MDDIIVMKKGELRALVSSAMQEVLSENKSHTSPPPDPDQLLSVKQVAALTGYTAGTIYQLIFRKKIPFTKPGGSKVMFRRGDLNDWIRQGQQYTPDQIRVQVDKNLSEAIR